MGTLFSKLFYLIDTRKKTKYKPLQNDAWQFWNISFILKINRFSD